MVLSGYNFIGYENIRVLKASDLLNAMRFFFSFFFFFVF